MSVIRERRKKAGLTQKSLAERLGVSQSTVAMWENGTNSPQSSILLSLARELGCSADEILMSYNKTRSSVDTPDEQSSA